MAGLVKSSYKTPDGDTQVNKSKHNTGPRGPCGGGGRRLGCSKYKDTIGLLGSVGEGHPGGRGGVVVSCCVMVTYCCSGRACVYTYIRASVRVCLFIYVYACSFTCMPARIVI